MASLHFTNAKQIKTVYLEMQHYLQGLGAKLFETAHFFFWLSKASDHPVTIAT